MAAPRTVATLRLADPIEPSPALLARIHAGLRVGARLDVRLRSAPSDGGIDGVRLLIEGAGFEGVRVTPDGAGTVRIRARRAFTLPDWIAPRLGVLVCGLNPSLYAAEHGMPFGRPGNRFWPAALAARLLERDRDLLAALEAGVGFTDLAKRPTARASELGRGEYRAGVERVGTLVRAFRPGTLLFVGLEGWRRALDSRARPGWVRGGFCGVDAYLMPSTSGLNTHARLEDLVRHLRRVRSRARVRGRSR